jgi:hypothetical protein
METIATFWTSTSANINNILTIMKKKNNIDNRIWRRLARSGRRGRANINNTLANSNDN